MATKVPMATKVQMVTKVPMATNRTKCHPRGLASYEIWACLFLFWHSKQFLYTTCSELVFFSYWTCNSMNNLLSYCGLTDSRMSASEKDLPVPMITPKNMESLFYNIILECLRGRLPVNWQISHCHWRQLALSKMSICQGVTYWAALALLLQLLVH